MFTSWSEQSTPAELSMASVLMRPPASANSIRARCVNPRLPPSATTRQRSSAASMRTASLVRSPTSASDSVVAFTNVPIPPFQRRSTGAREHRADQLIGRERSVAEAEDAPRLGRRIDRLRVALVRPRPRPRAPRGRSRPTTTSDRANRRWRSAKLAAGSGSGSTNTWRWSNAASSCTCGDRSRPLPNTSPDMSPMPTTVRRRGVGVDRRGPGSAPAPRSMHPAR